MLVAVALAGAGAAAHADPAVERQNKAAVVAAFDDWRAGKGGIAGLLADDVEWTITGSSPVSTTYRSKQEFVARVLKPFGARLSSPLVPTVRGIYAEGDMVIVHWEGAATAKDGKPFQSPYAWFLQFRDGRIVRGTAFFDGIVYTDFWTRVSPD